MKIHALITGSTGMMGKAVLLECLDHPEVESVVVLNRTPLGMTHPKLKEILHTDFFDLIPIADQLKGINTCFFCLGVSAPGMSESQYHHLTYDLTLHAAKTLVGLNPDMSFCYITGAGTDSTEKGKIMWARIKGKTENALLALPFKAAYMFRPSYIHPLKGVKTKVKLYALFYCLLSPLYPLLKHLTPNHVTTSVTLAKAMINAVLYGSEKKILEVRDINAIGKRPS